MGPRPAIHQSRATRLAEVQQTNHLKGCAGSYFMFLINDKVVHTLTPSEQELE